MELSHQVKALIGEAAAAFVDGDLNKTMLICQQVISIEPAAHAAWNTLSLVHEELNDPETALKLKIMAAHLQGDADLWRELGRASRYVHLQECYKPSDSLVPREGKQTQQALYCFRKAVSLNPRDVDALWDRSIILREDHQDKGVGLFTITA